MALALPTPGLADPVEVPPTPTPALATEASPSCGEVCSDLPVDPSATAGASAELCSGDCVAWMQGFLTWFGVPGCGQPECAPAPCECVPPPECECEVPPECCVPPTTAPPTTTPPSTVPPTTVLPSTVPSSVPPGGLVPPPPPATPLEESPPVVG